MTIATMQEQLMNLTIKIQELFGKAKEKVDRMLAEFNAALPVLEALGLSLKDFKMGMGIIPEIQAKLVGSLEDVKEDKIEEMIEQYQDNKTLTTVLKALKMAASIRKRVEGIPFTGIEVGLKLGLPPNVSVGFVESQAANQVEKHAA
ncbi:MAG: hypothetical protein OEY91_04875 [Nitrospirota bacterium]|nr:hypothetical protein [Nitrospirota bacterium]